MLSPECPPRNNYAQLICAEPIGTASTCDIVLGTIKSAQTYSLVRNMKLASVAALNALGFQNPYQKALYAATLLFAGTNTSAQATITPAVAKIPAKAALVGTGTPAAPQFPAVPEVPAVPAVVAPAVTPVPQYAGTVVLEESATEYHVIARLPYAPNLLGRGLSLQTKSIGEITSKALDLGSWLGAKASETVGIDTGAPDTVEKYLYDRALEIESSMTPAELSALAHPIISKKNLPDVNKTPVIQIDLILPKLIGSSTYLGGVGKALGSAPM